MKNEGLYDHARSARAKASDIRRIGFGAARAIDGKVYSPTKKGKQSSRWASNRRPGTKWLRLCFPQPIAVQSLVIHWYQRNATQYRVLLSVDGKNYQEVYSATRAPLCLRQRIVLATPVSAKYLRLEITQYQPGIEDGVSVCGLEVYTEIVPQTLEDIAASLCVTAQPGDTAVRLSDLPQGYSARYIGTDYSQVIDHDGVIHPPLVDTTVHMDFSVSDGKADFPVCVPVLVPGTKPAAPDGNPKPVVIPALREWLGASGVYRWQTGSRIVMNPNDAVSLERTMQTFAQDLQCLFGKLPEVIAATQDSLQPGDIFAILSCDDGLGAEGYLLEINDTLTIRANASSGAFWATRSILQLLRQNEAGTVPCGTARDYPRFPVRGFMLDVGRKPFSMDILYEIVKQMSWYKMNDFHVHLNDNYIQLDKVKDPFSAYSGFRLESDIPGLTSKDLSYTKQEFREFIQFATLYGVNIVPEFDVPAHSLALTKVRPDLALGKKGLDADHLNLKNPDTLPFVKQLFAEFLQQDDPVFSGDVMHIGTDEYSEKYTEEFRKFVDEMIRFVRDDCGKTVRLWGSLTMRAGKTPVSSENVQMNIWSLDWSDPLEMYQQGFQLINIDDAHVYIVPAAKYYRDFLDLEYLYRRWTPNCFHNQEIPAGSPQMLGGAFAIWNDLIGDKDNGLTQLQVLERMTHALPVMAEKTWGMAQDHKFAAHRQYSKMIGNAPGGIWDIA